tara:strand:- start:163 stop:420 length:258 start_codon:yes stop_codon:yes gene_type:complete
VNYFLTIIICSVVNGKTFCVPPVKMEDEYIDSYTCLLDGYNKAHDKIVEIGRDSVNEYNIYIKFGCNENIPNETPTSHIIIKQEI